MINNFKILEEGYKNIFIYVLITLIVKFFVCSFLGNLLLFGTLFVLWIYRDTSRLVFKNKEKILAPIDGKIKAIDVLNDVTSIYIDVNLCGEHILKSPIKGKIKIKSFYHGLNLSVDTFKAKQLNQRATISIGNLKLKLLGGVCNDKILIDDKKELKQGERFGLFLNGLIVLQIKEPATLSVKIGDKIKAGQTIIG